MGRARGGGLGRGACGRGAVRPGGGKPHRGGCGDRRVLRSRGLGVIPMIDQAPAQRRTRAVLMTADTLGGVWEYSMELARGLAAEGIRVLLATLGRLPSRAQ